MILELNHRQKLKWNESLQIQEQPFSVNFFLQNLNLEHQHMQKVSETFHNNISMILLPETCIRITDLLIRQHKNQRPAAQPPLSIYLWFQCE